MKKRIFTCMVLISIFIYSFNAWASKKENDIGVHARTKYGVEDVVEGSVDVKTGEHVVEMEEGKLQIRVSGVVDETARLMVMPISRKKKEVWEWLQSITKEIGVNKSAYDIFFVNEKGKRIELGEGSQVSVISNIKTQKVSVYYITDEGKHSALKTIIEEYVVKFKMIKNGYYTLLVQNGKEQVGTGIGKEEDKIKPVEDENKEPDSSDNEVVEEDEDEITNEDVVGGNEAESVEKVLKEKTDKVWLIIMISIILFTVVLFVIVFVVKKKKK